MIINDDIKNELIAYFNNHRYCNHVNKYIIKNSQTDLYIEQQLRLHPWFQTKKKFISCFVKEIYEPVKCKTCNKLVKLDNALEGKVYCSVKCAQVNHSTIEKRKNTNLINIGVEFPAQNFESKRKFRQTMKNKYGAEYSLQSKQIKDKYDKTMMEKHGVYHPMESSDLRNKIKSTLKQKYNVECPFQIDYIKENNKKRQHQKGYDIILNKWKNYVKPLFTVDEYRGLQQKNLHTIYKWQCVKCNHIFEQASHSSGLYQDKIGSSYLPVCPICYPINKSMSNIEKEVVEFIKSIYNGEIIQNNRQLINPYELDMVIIDKKLAIEFDGLYWHNDSKIKDENYHLNKTELCESKNIRLIHIFEDEWINKKDVIKNIIKSYLDLNEKININNCKLKEVDSFIANQFLKENDLKDDLSYDKNYGVFHDDIMIAIIVFRGSLARLILKTNIDIDGDLKTLLQPLKSIYGDLFLEVDRRYENYKFYNSFRLVDKIKPDFYWTKNHCRISKLCVDKNDKTFINSYNKIFDCGKLIYII